MTAAEAHPPIHELAELAEGVLDDARAREVRSHVDQCLTCQASIDELAQVTVALRELPAELPVPEFVAARISHALAAERAAAAHGPGASGSAGGTGTDGGTVAWFRRRLPQGVAAAASVAVLGLAGYVAVSGGGGSGGDESAVDSGVVAADGGAAPSGSSGDARAQTAPSPGPAGAEETPSSIEGDESYTVYSEVDEAELTAAVEDVVRQRTSHETGCGDDLAAEQGLPLLGSKPVGAGVLVVLEGDGFYDGWLLSVCSSLSNETLEPPVQVPASE